MDSSLPALFEFSAVVTKANKSKEDQKKATYKRVEIRKFEMISKKVEESRMRAWLRKKSSIERSTRCSN